MSKTGIPEAQTVATRSALARQSSSVSEYVHTRVRARIHTRSVRTPGSGRRLKFPVGLRGAAPRPGR